jgi:ATP-binding cassette, subfamily B, multidrug efflux pump
MDGAIIGRAAGYLRRVGFAALVPYLLLIVATLSQLAVPHMLSNIIDAVSRGVIADIVIGNLRAIPPAALQAALPKLLAYFNLPAGLSLDDVMARMAAQKAAAPNDLLWAAVAVVAFAAVRGVFAFLQAYSAERSSQGVAYELRNDLYAKITRLSYSYHDTHQTGQLMIRATDDVENVRLFIGQGLLQLVGAFVLMTGTLIILFTANFPLMLSILWIVPVALVLFLFFGRASRPIFTQVQIRLSTLNTRLQENLAGIRVVKAFAREPSEQAKFRTAADELQGQQIKVARLFSFLFPVAFLMANLGQASIYYFGGRQIILGTLTLGEWQEFTMYLFYLFFPLAMFGMIVTQFSQAAASAARIFEILDAPVEIADKADAVTLPPIRGRVVFDHVTFRYAGEGAPALDDVSFDIAPGQTVALLGATGSGKTSVINMIPRFYDPTAGCITIDGYDLRDVTQSSLRGQIGIVLQETTLFAGSVRDNIAFGRMDATQADVENAARAAKAHEFICALPQGYDTPLGERGATLSGGQKQRIAIARALLIDPKILILDDSTSSVDLTTEAQIQNALARLLKDRTSFVIAQRISTVMQADVILVLERGAIAARGTHAELMEDSPIYAEIYRSQLTDDTAR